MNNTKFLYVHLFQRILFASLCLSSIATWASPTTLTYQGRIVKSDGSPLIFDNVSFIFKITDPSGACVIYQEQFSGYDMTNSKGIFDVAIGTGSVIFPADGSLNVLDVFNNSLTYACNGGGGATYTPGISDGRKLRVQFHDGIGWQTITPDSTIRSVPFAGYAVSARKLGSYSATDFLLKAGLPTCAADNFLTWDGTHLTCSASSGGGGGGGGTVTSVTSTNSYITVANNTTTAQVTLNVGTGANTVAAGNDSRIVNALQSGGTASGDLSGTYPSPQVIALRGVGVSSATPSAGNYLKYDGSNWAPSAVTVSDISGLSTQLSNKIDASQMPANCGANQTLAFSSPTGTWTCNNITTSQWTTTGSNIYYNTGNVGIGTTSPSQALSVAGTIESTSGGFKFPDGTTQTTAAGGVSGTAGRLAKFSGAGTSLANSLIQDNGSIVSVGITPDAYNLAGTTLRTGSIQMGNTSNFSNQDYYLTAGANSTTVPVANTYPYALIAATAYQNYNVVGIGGSADANSSIAAAQLIQFFTNPTFNSTTYTERMRIQPNGNVGIGTNSPGQALSVAGVVESTSGGFKFPDGTTQTTASSGGSWTTNGSNISNANSGNVGIGTSSPSQTLEVSSSTAVPLITSTGSYGGNYVGGGFLAQGLPRANGYFAFDSSANEWFSGLPYGGSGYAINYKSTTTHTNATSDITGLGGSSNYFYIATNGNVGIGTTSPGLKFDVTGAGRFSDGVGIHGATPSQDCNGQTCYLSVNGNSNLNGIRISGADGQNTIFQQTSNVDLSLTANGGAVRFGQTNTPDDLYISKTGRVGIGTTGPGYKLDVNGDTNIASGSVLRFGGTQVCSSTGCTSSSDRTLKENITPLEESLEKILQLQAVRYDYKDKVRFGDRKHIGLIAQDVEKIYPEVVVTDKQTHLKSIAYDHLVAPLIEAVKVLSDRLALLEKDHSQLYEENQLLKQKLQQMDSLQKYLCSKDPQAEFCK
ncbi:tail fiber domain-containing protein [Bdellovibrio sp. NC01]|uniref:tail fiber domain-containing protein n=1 Tax=Bdellovibrio sp. NC01 TaxID=2220073 RepID=UPI00115BF443|nr:tail fiber domain-containing protein [Bdellovibrio sp. NC01]QDK38056.1 hypothetical protein DOE51_10885 [Bdellovibrio sp. NC01]